MHNCLSKVEQSRHFVRGAFKAPNTIFDKIQEQTGILVNAALKYLPYRTTYDIEYMLCLDALPSDTQTCHFVNKHALVSISVCSNVPGFEETTCFVRKNSKEIIQLVERFYDYMSAIQQRSEELQTSA